MDKYQILSEAAIDSIQFRTGDVLLFAAKKGFITKMISLCTHSIYTHVAVVIKDPDFDTFKASGIYAIESTTLDRMIDSEDKVVKFGVQIHPLKLLVSDYPGQVFVRHLHIDRNKTFERAVKTFHKSVHGDPYDLNPLDWVEMSLQEYSFDKHVKTEFICSALVSYFLVFVGALTAQTPWTLIRPVDLGQESVKRYDLDFLHGNYLGDTIEIIS